MATAPSHGLKVYSTRPPSNQAQPREYLRRVRDIARWSADAGCEGILVNADNGPFDSWLASQAFEGRHYCVANPKLAPAVG